MKRLTIIVALLVLSGLAFGEVVTEGKTIIATKVCTLATNKACTTAAIDVKSLGGFGIRAWDSVKSTTTGTLTVKIQGCEATTVPTKANVMWSASAFTDSLPISALSITAKGPTTRYDWTAKVPRVPYVRYIMTNAGDSLWCTLYWLMNEDK